MPRLCYFARRYASILITATLGVFCCLYITACDGSAGVRQPVPVYTYKVINTFPHDPNAFTQGLEFENGIMYEGTGLYGESSIRKIELETGKILQIYNLPERFYGEGITIYKDTLIQLTLENETGFIYDKNSFELIRDFPYAGEGWGITHDNVHIITSDGSSTLQLLDPATMKTTGHIQVSDNGVPVTMINELEYVKGKIYANIWKKDKIAIIEPNGQVSGWIDLTGLLDSAIYGDTADVLNGIAYDDKTGRLFVTGKLWPVIFEIDTGTIKSAVQR